MLHIIQRNCVSVVFWKGEKKWTRESRFYCLIFFDPKIELHFCCPFPSSSSSTRTNLMMVGHANQGKELWWCYGVWTQWWGCAVVAGTMRGHVLANLKLGTAHDTNSGVAFRFNRWGGRTMRWWRNEGICLRWWCSKVNVARRGGGVWPWCWDKREG